MRMAMKGRTLSLVLVGAVAAAALISPVAAGPNDPATKKFARKVARKIGAKKAKSYFDKNIGAASVANAKNAAAVNGLAITPFFFQAAPGTADAVIGTYGPMTLKATCDLAGEPHLRASWTDTVNHMTHNGSEGQYGNGSVAAGNTITIGHGPFGTVGQASAIGHTTKAYTAVEYFLRDSPALGDAMCFFSGHVSVK